jgi:hypothetical protein
MKLIVTSTGGQGTPLQLKTQVFNTAGIVVLEETAVIPIETAFSAVARELEEDERRLFGLFTAAVYNDLQIEVKGNRYLNHNVSRMIATVQMVKSCGLKLKETHKKLEELIKQPQPTG